MAGVWNHRVVVGVPVRSVNIHAHHRREFHSSARCLINHLECVGRIVGNFLLSSFSIHLNVNGDVLQRCGATLHFQRWRDYWTFWCLATAPPPQTKPPPHFSFSSPVRLAPDFNPSHLLSSFLSLQSLRQHLYCVCLHNDGRNPVSAPCDSFS